MKKIATSLLALLAGSISVFAQLTEKSGGPDAYGYSWISSDTTAGPSFSWVDISGVGTDITSGLGDDNSVGPFTIGFDLPFYWYTASEFFVGSNGYITFDKGATISSGQSSTENFLPFPNTDNFSNIVAPLLSDLSFSGASNPGKVWFYTNNTDSLVITFENVPFWVDSAGTAPDYQGSNTFQMVFNGGDNSIAINYLNQEGSWSPTYDALAGASQIGIESIEGVAGVTCESSVRPSDSLKVLFSLTQNTAFALNDAIVASNNNDKNGGIFISSNEHTTFSASVQNTGTADITTSFNLNTVISRSASGGGTIYEDTKTVPSIMAGAISEFTFDKSLKPIDTNARFGTSHFMTTTIDIADDVTGNNEKVSEVVILDDTVRSQVVMSFANFSAGTDIFGFEGAGVYFEPPYYPVTVRVAEYGVVANANGSTPAGFTAKIWDNTGTNGAPGNVLDTKVVPAGDINTAGGALDIVEVLFDNPPTINSGGFYISFEVIDDANIALAIDNIASAPKSNQNYEVIAGTFGEYRNNETEDVMIRTIIEAPAVNGVEDQLNVELGNIYPNPVTDIASINFSVESASAVSFAVKNVIGQNVKSVELGTVNAGTQTVSFDVNDLEAGIYFYTLNVNDKSYTKKFIVK